MIAVNFKLCRPIGFIIDGMTGRLENKDPAASMLYMHRSCRVVPVFYCTEIVRHNLYNGLSYPVRNPARLDMGLMAMCTMSSKSVTSDVVGDSLELSRRVGTDRLNGTDTNNNDQCQHDRVLNSGGSVFFFQKVDDLGCEALHRIFLSGLK